MIEHFRIIPATEMDLPKLAALVNSAYRGESSKMGWTTEADLLDGQRTDETELSKQLVQQGNSILKYIDESDKIIGCVYLHIMDKIMNLGMLTVSPTLQARGIGKQLLLYAEQFALEQCCTCVELMVISVRHSLIDWYHKHGYHSTGKTKPFPKDEKFGIVKQPLEFIVLEKRL